jgi:hypothetical protein
MFVEHLEAVKVVDKQHSGLLEVLEST